MAILIPTNSFIRPYVAPIDNCAEQIKLCLPVYDVDDIAFMFYNLDVAPGESWQYKVSIFKDGAEIGTPKIMSKSHVIMTFDDYVYINDISAMGFDADLECGECFNLRVSADVSSNAMDEHGDPLFPTYTVVLFQSICLQKTCDPCWTSVIKYRCEENSFGFQYFLDNGSGVNLLSTFYNKIRLPFYLKKPQFPISRNVFIKSNGTRKKLSARIASEYEVSTDYMQKDWHEKLIIALEHDQVFITNVNSGLTVQSVSQEGDYQINWQDFLDYPTAPASFKLFITPYNNVNSNCN